MRFVDDRPRLEGRMAVQFLLLPVVENHELLVGRRIHEETVVPVSKSLLELLCHVVGVSGDAEIQPVGEQRVELDAQQTSLCQEGTVLLDDGEEVSQQLRRMALQSVLHYEYLEGLNRTQYTNHYRDIDSTNRQQ